MTYNESERSKRKVYKTVKTEGEKAIDVASKNGFPNCKGLYPDCPEKPDKECKQCRTCPVLDEEE